MNGEIVLRHRNFVTAAFVAGIIASTQVAAPAHVQEASTRLAGSLQATPATGVAGDTVTLYGKVPPLRKHDVKLQRRTGSEWKTILTDRTDAAGRFSFASTLPEAVTSVTYRVKSPRTEFSASFVTPSRRILIDPITRISAGEYHSYAPLLSGDGNYVAWTAPEANANQETTIVRYWSRQTRVVEEIYRSDAHYVEVASVSDDGRYVLIALDQGSPSPSAVLWDRETGQVDEMPATAPILRWPALSGNGRYVSYVAPTPSDDIDVEDVYVLDLADDSIQQITAGDLHSAYTSISDDGRYIAFASSASNLVPGDSILTPDLFVADTVSESATRITDGDAKILAPAISGDGEWVTWSGSTASEWAQRFIFAWHRPTDVLTQITDTAHADTEPQLSDKGFVITFSRERMIQTGPASDSRSDICYWKADTAETQCEVSGNGDSRRPSISDNGAWIVFDSAATDLTTTDAGPWNGVFLVDRRAM